MEQIERRHSFTGLTIDSDPSLRMQTRPTGTGITPGAGKPREDFGSSGFKHSPRKSKLNKTRPASTQSTTISIGSSEDDDDIDLFDSAPGTSRLRTAKIRKTTASGSRDIVEKLPGVAYKGQVHEYHPDYLPKPKLPNFKKNKSTNQTEDGGDSTSSRADTPDRPQQPKVPSKNLPLIPKQTHQKTRTETPPPSPPRSSQPPSSPLPKSRPKPRPRPIKKPPTCIPEGADSFDISNDPVVDRGEEPVPCETKGRPKPVKKQPTKYIPREFPLLKNPSFQSDQPLRVVSNLSPSRSRRSSPEISDDVKAKDRVLTVSGDDTEDHAGQVPQPFPLSTGFMGSTPKASKRHPEDETHSGGSERKKLKESLPKWV